MDRETHLRRLLAAHQTEDDREHDYLQRMRALSELGPAAFDRESYRPGHFTASAFVLSPTRDELLLILHAKLGLWLQPGGHVEPTDANIQAAARREVHEETGLDELVAELDGALDVDIHQIPAGKAPAHLHHDVRFLFRAPRRSIVAASDALEARWVRLGDIGTIHSDDSVMRAVARVEHFLTSRRGGG